MFIHLYTNLTDQTKSFDSSLGKYMRKATRPLGGMDSLNPHRWRGKWLHHHGGGVCWLFVWLWIDSWHHELIIWKKWYKHNLKMVLMALLFGPPRRAPHHGEQPSVSLFYQWDYVGQNQFYPTSLERRLWNIVWSAHSFCHSKNTNGLFVWRQFPSSLW